MRISRYYPAVDYQTDFELSDKNLRKSKQLEPGSSLKKLEDPNQSVSDVITLNMIISTSNNQTAIGTGEPGFSFLNLSERVMVSRQSTFALSFNN